MFERWVEDGLLDVLEQEGIGCIVFSPLAQGLLTDRYLSGIPIGARATKTERVWLTERHVAASLEKVRKLDAVAQRRGSSLAQMAIAWVLRKPQVTSALIGASSVRQLETNIAALDKPPLGADELREIEAILKD
jgi:L-glyceraldehyde 3-phosphate reductase